MTTTLREIALKQILEASEIELLVPVSHTAAPEPPDYETVQSTSLK
ncbi:hypothetical protein [Acaryochloris marina]|uniref:Uncharacterized protein n=1 Tax=Acaryochloris marina (strain MBIC 11017) TaxID=329726 RepID=A8ZKT5_ACAM1|nr:hypothetical protein [Acaryochloris marina]ABW31403.1 hypothetical protein AM1_A0285 [Acaryochloris marina MBIC11017]BDM83463.1 hypothetical protein AM10699_63240 [Acaryochloris marina MBIC10699]